MARQSCRTGANRHGAGRRPAPSSRRISANVGSDRELIRLACILHLETAVRRPGKGSRSSSKEPDAADEIGSAQQQVAFRFGPPKADSGKGWTPCSLRSGVGHVEKGRCSTRDPTPGSPTPIFKSEALESLPSRRPRARAPGAAGTAKLVKHSGAESAQPSKLSRRAELIRSHTRGRVTSYRRAAEFFAGAAV